MPSSWLKNDTYLSLAFVHGGTTQHSSTQPWKTVTTWGFWAKKKKLSKWGLRSIMSRKLYFGLSHKISNFMWHDPIHEPIHDLIRDLVRNPIQSDPSDDWPRDCRMRQSVTQSWGTEKLAKVAVWKAFVSFLLLFARISFSKGDYSMNGTVYYTDGWVCYSYSVFVTVNLIFGIILWSTSTAKKRKRKKLMHRILMFMLEIVFLWAGNGYYKLKIGWLRAKDLLGWSHLSFPRWYVITSYVTLHN